MHGFLAYLAPAIREERQYRIYGYKGKQVRDNLHSFDVCSFVEAFHASLGSRRSTTWRRSREQHLVIEAIERLDQLLGRSSTSSTWTRSRVGDHICYISDLRKIRATIRDGPSSIPSTRILSELAGVYAGSSSHATLGRDPRSQRGRERRPDHRRTPRAAAARRDRLRGGGRRRWQQRRTGAEVEARARVDRDVPWSGTRVPTDSDEPSAAGSRSIPETRS
jgi:hypothetical protein